MHIKPKPKPFIIWGRNRIKNNKNCLIVVNGSTGSGKTYAALKLAQEFAEEMGTNFSIKDNVAFKFPDLLKKMQLPQNEKPGTPFVFEEVGAFGGGASSREWQSKSNKFFNTFMQTSRHRNQIVFLTCPLFHNLDLSSRQLVHMQLTMMDIDKKKNIALVKPMRIQVNNRTGKFFFKYLRVREQSRSGKYNRMAVGHPGEEVAKIYEVDKRKFTDEINKSIMEDDKPKAKKGTAVDKEVVKTLIQQGYTRSKIAEVLNISEMSVTRVRRELLENHKYAKEGLKEAETGVIPKGMKGNNQFKLPF